MGHWPRDDWIVSILPTYSLRQIPRIGSVRLNRVRAVCDAHITETKLFPRLGAPCKATSPIKQDMMILLPNDIEDFTIRPPFEVDVIRIFAAIKSSRPLPISQISPGHNVESGIASIDPSDATLPDEFPCTDGYFEAPDDQIRCVPSLDHEAVETFDSYPAEIPLNIQIMSQILENKPVLQFNCFVDFFTQITVPEPSVPVAIFLRWVF
jgi:hypothetical protein